MPTTDPAGMFHTHACLCPGCLEPPPEPDGAGDPEALAADFADGPYGTSGKPVYDTDGIERALTTGDRGYGSRAWVVDSVTYSLGTGAIAVGQPGYRSEYAGYVAMTAKMEATAREAFEMWDELIAIDLVELSNDKDANVLFNYSSATGGGTYARSWTSWQQAGDLAESRIDASQIWLAHNWWTHDQDSDLVPGGYGIFTYLHEIGHALGLYHPGPYNGSASFGPNATYDQDTRAFTVMSYFDAEANGSGTDHVQGGRKYGSTPLLHDILVAQAIYGADMTTRTGDSVYGFNSNAGHSAYNFAANPHPVVAIWDAGGNDTIDLSGYMTAQVLSLAEGSFSSVGVLTDNLAIAWGAVIENAIGGGAGDILTGNAADNRLEGRAGADRLEGLEGDDRLDGGAGADVILGGFGTDTLVFATAGAGVTVDLAAGTGLGGDAAGDTYAGIENVEGTDSADSLTGDDGPNRLSGLGGTDRISGGGGDDLLEGGDGFDLIWGGTGNDILRGGGAMDVLAGGAGDDVLEGGEGDDRLRGSAGADRLDGGPGQDWADYRGAGAGIAADLGLGSGSAGIAAGDSYVDVEFLWGSAHDDVLIGDGGTNLIRGDDGADLIDGGGGSDYLTGGAGADIFRFTGEGGMDRITDFAAGIDTIRFEGGVVSGFEELIFRSFRGDMVVVYDPGDAIILYGIAPGALDAGDFSFA